MQLAFLDELGRSRQESHIVVAGVLVSGDRDYRALEGKLRELRERYIPEPDRDGFVFHAKDIFHGAKYFKDKTLWPPDKRFPILRDLAALPAKMGLPVAFGHVEKKDYWGDQAVQVELAKHAEKDRQNISDIVQHMHAFARCEVAVERVMHTLPRDQVCMVIAEDTDRVKFAVKRAQAELKDPNSIIFRGISGISGLPLTKIVDTPHFAAKADSVPLQVADTCAFLTMRRFLRREDTQEFFELLVPQLIWRAVDFGEPMGNEAQLWQHFQKPVQTPLDRY